MGILQERLDSITRKKEHHSQRQSQEHTLFYARLITRLFMQAVNRKTGQMLSQTYREIETAVKFGFKKMKQKESRKGSGRN